MKGFKANIQSFKETLKGYQVAIQVDKTLFNCWQCGISHGQNKGLYTLATLQQGFDMLLQTLYREVDIEKGLLGIFDRETLNIFIAVCIASHKPRGGMEIGVQAPQSFQGEDIGICIGKERDDNFYY